MKAYSGFFLILISVTAGADHGHETSSPPPAATEKPAAGCTNPGPDDEVLVPTTSVPFSIPVEERVSISPESVLVRLSVDHPHPAEPSKMSLTKACCSNPAMESDYEATGTDIQLEDGLTVYETGDRTSNILLISVYDIFGFTPQAKQVADKIGGTGFRVALPGFFRDGSPWNHTNFPPADRQELLNWIGKVGNWETIKVDILAVIEHYKKQGVATFGIFGFCWGGKMAIQAGAEIPEIKGVGLVHPSFMAQEDFEKIKSPVLILPSKDEADLIPFYNIAKERLGENAVEHVRFDDMSHGFAAARGDFKDELIRKRVDEVLLLLVTFFKKHL